MIPKNDSPLYKPTPPNIDCACTFSDWSWSSTNCRKLSLFRNERNLLALT